MLDIRVDDLTDLQTLALIDEHFADMRAGTPLDSCHVLTSDALRSPDITVWTVWNGDEIAAVGALRRLDQHNGEIKSMRTTTAARGTGAGRALLRHILDAAERDDVTDLWLETGVGDMFLPARSLYASEGFVQCEAFTGYHPDPLSFFMHRSV